MRRWIVFISWYVVIGFYSIAVFLAFLFFLCFYSEFTKPTIKAGRRPLVQNASIRSNRLGWKKVANIQINLRSYDGTRKEVYYSTNSKGLRVSPYKKGNPVGLLLGDSMVEGYYLTDKETLPWRLSELLNHNVINGGIGGYSTDQEYLLLEDLLHDYEFSWVGLIFFANDLPYNDKSVAWDGNKPRFRIVDGLVDFKTLIPPAQKMPRSNKEAQDSTVTLCCGYDNKRFKDNVLYNFNELLKRLRGSPKNFLSWSPGNFFYKLKKILYYQLGSNQYNYQLKKKIYTNPESSHYEFSIAFQFFEQIQKISKTHKFKFFVVILPEIAQVVNKDEPDDTIRFQQYFLEMCAIRGIECFDPLKEFIDEQKKEDIYFMDDGHLSPYGADFLAKLIVDKVLSGKNDYNL